MAAPVWLRRVCRRPVAGSISGGKSVNVGGFQLGEFAKFEHFAGQFVEQGQLGQHVGGGGARAGAAALARKVRGSSCRREFRRTAEAN